MAKTKFMKNIDILEKFCREMENGTAKNRSFKQICKSIGVNHVRANACLVESLGVSGEIITECFRRDVPACLIPHLYEQTGLV